MTGARRVPAVGRARRGFTLLEALVAVGMLVLLLGALAMFAEDLSRTRSFVARTAARTRSADALFGALESALQTAVVDGGGMGAGVSGTDRSIRVLSSRTDAGSGSVRQLARAAFAPLSATQVTESAGSVVVGRGGTSSVLPARVRAMRIRYWTEDGWSDSFDSLAGGSLPAAVEVALWFGEQAAASDGLDRARGESQDEPLDDEAVQGLGVPDRVRTIAVPDATGASVAGIGGAP